MGVLLLMAVLGAIARPHLLFILVDDLDTVLNSTSVLKKTNRLLASEGTVFTNMFAATPLCCPSRSTIASGRYQHNHRCFNNALDQGCSSAWWQKNIEPFAFPVALQAAGYETAFFGKYLNQYGSPEVGGVSHVPKGWTEWFGLVGNSKYYNYTVSHNGVGEKHGHNFQADYFTNLLANHSADWLDTKLTKSNQPIMAMVSTPACHTPNDAAPEHQHLFPSSTAPRIPSFGAAKRDRNFLVTWHADKWSDSHVKASDLIHRRRLQSLQSLDNLVERLYNVLDTHKQLNNTYILLTSDNGYHLGQFRLPEDKRTPYESDIRLPLYVRPPSPPKPKGSTPNFIDAPVLTVDIAPTLLDLAHASPVATQDGVSFAPLVSPSKSTYTPRKEVLIEYWGDEETPFMMAFDRAEPPYYTGKPFLFTVDFENNTYSCLRSLEGANHQYCQFYKTWGDKDMNTTYEEEFYDVGGDPWQQTNDIRSMPEGLRTKYHRRLEELRRCVGTECH